tara:strand:+ start:120 stop:338 length:219 start_codon:yes stop_codon:yes gene_type:complete
MLMDFAFRDSASIKGFSYCPEKAELDVWFVNGRTYRYYDVHASVIDGWKRAESAGKFFNRQIKDQHKYEQLK